MGLLWWVLLLRKGGWLLLYDWPIRLSGGIIGLGIETTAVPLGIGVPLEFLGL